jgi:acyl dehydratase
MTGTLHFEDLEIGRSFACGTYAVTKDEIIEFASEFDPQPHHLDEEAAKNSMLGGLAASGWHVCAMTMRMFADHMIPRMAERGGSGSPEARWMKPVRPGDHLRTEAIVVGKKESRARTDIGHVTFECRVYNQTEQVCLLYMTPVVARRDAA